MIQHQYETRPLDCWREAKELRTAYYEDIRTAKDKGKLFVVGGAEAPYALLAGFGDFAFLAGEPYAASIATDPVFSQRCAEATESRGFSRDLCAYMRNYWGSVFINQYLFGNEFPKPDLCLQLHCCDTHGKWFQVMSEHFNIPYICVDYPVGSSIKTDEARIEYLAGQFHDAVEKLERVTGRRCDDEKLIDAVRNECRSMALWSEICILNKAIPAPLDQKTMLSLYVHGINMRHEQIVVNFYQHLRDEVRDRVNRRIAALATERCRLMDDSQPPWYFLKLYKYVQQYGAVFVGSYYSFTLPGNFDFQPDGTIGPAKTPEERGMKLKSRGDALRALALWYAEKPALRVFSLPQYKMPILERMVSQWHVNGVVIHLNRGCEGAALGQMEYRLALQKVGIPVMTYEGNMGDKREFDEAQVLDRLDAFMESLGLRKLIS